MGGIKFPSALLFALPFLFSCGTKKEVQSGAPVSVVQEEQSKGPSLSVMEFNVENMFDNIHDANTDDETYLSKATKDASTEIQAKCHLEQNSFYRDECLNLDWSDEVIDAKLHNVAATITSVENGRGPDMILMEEVENINILSKLRDEHLTAAQYQTTVLIEGFDTRGIDVAFMSRLPLRKGAEPTLHRIPLVPQNPNDQAGMLKTRGILEIPLALPNGEPLTVFVVHFPSQSNPRYWREQAVHYLTELLAQHANEYVIAGGDFNISTQEETATQWFHNTLANAGLVTHVVGCQDCLGTSYYKSGFDFLDAMVFSGLFRQNTSNWQLDIPSITVVRAPHHTDSKGAPIRFNPVAKTGVSDHLPTFARIRLTK